MKTKSNWAKKIENKEGKRQEKEEERRRKVGKGEKNRKSGQK